MSKNTFATWQASYSENVYKLPNACHLIMKLVRMHPNAAVLVVCACNCAGKPKACKSASLTLLLRSCQLFPLQVRARTATNSAISPPRGAHCNKFCNFVAGQSQHIVVRSPPKQCYPASVPMTGLHVLSRNDAP